MKTTEYKMLMGETNGKFDKICNLYSKKGWIPAGEVGYPNTISQQLVFIQQWCKV